MPGTCTSYSSTKVLVLGQKGFVGGPFCTKQKCCFFQLIEWQGSPLGLFLSAHVGWNLIIIWWKTGSFWVLIRYSQNKTRSIPFQPPGRFSTSHSLSINVWSSPLSPIAQCLWMRICEGLSHAFISKPESGVKDTIPESSKYCRVVEEKRWFMALVSIAMYDTFFVCTVLWSSRKKDLS